MNIGGTAVGTGINAETQYPELMVKHLHALTGLPLEVSDDRVQLMQSMGDIATFSGAVRAFVLDLCKIADDIRLLASATAHRTRRNPPAGRCSRARASCRGR